MKTDPSFTLLVAILASALVLTALAVVHPQAYHVPHWSMALGHLRR